LESVVAVRRRERMEREKEREREETERGKKGSVGGSGSGSGKSSRKSSKEKESRRSLEGRKRTPLSAVFPPDVNGNGNVSEESSPVSVSRYPPILTVESATSDGHSACGNDDSLATMTMTTTPLQRGRARPLSEQMIGRERPRGMYESDNGMFFFVKGILK
jgi:serine/arginine repetitive matrix protein 2